MAASRRSKARRAGVRQAQIGKQVGSTGLNVVGGYIDDEYLANLRGSKKYKVYREMGDSDPVIGGSLLAYSMMCRAPEWRVEEHPDGRPEDAEFLRSCLEDMKTPFEDIVAAVARNTLQYGFAVNELVYKRRTDGKIGWKTFAERRPETISEWVFDTDEDDELVAIIQRSPNHGWAAVEIPAQKILLFRLDSAGGNPEGRSLLRSVYRPWFFRKRLEELEGTGFERNLAGLPVLRVPERLFARDATAEDQAELAAYAQMGENLRYDQQGYMVLPDTINDKGEYSYGIELLSSQADGRGAQVDVAIIRHRSEIAMAMMTGFLLLGHEQVGSFALSDSKTNLFGHAAGMVLDRIQDSLNRDAVPRLFRLNGMPTENLPKIVHGDVETPDVERLANLISSLTSAGFAFDDTETQAYVRQVASLPALPAEAVEEAEAQVAFEREQAKKAREESLLPTDAPTEPTPDTVPDTTDEEPTQ